MTNKRNALNSEDDASRHKGQADAATATCGDQTISDQSVTSQQKKSLLSCFSSSETSPAATGKAKRARRGGRKNDLNVVKAKLTNFSKDANIQHNLLPAAVTKDTGLFAEVPCSVDGRKKMDVRKMNSSFQSTYQRKSNTPKNVDETYQSNQRKTNLLTIKHQNLKNQHEIINLNSPFNTNITDLNTSDTSNATDPQKPNTYHPPNPDILKDVVHHHPYTPAREPAEPVKDSSALRQLSFTTEQSRKPRGSRRDKDRGRARSACRERSRVEELRQGYQKLQAAIPAVPKNTKLAKLDVLVLAASYIAHLTRRLKEDEGAGEFHEGTDCFEGPYSAAPRTPLPPSITCCQQQPLKMPSKRWPMRARLYAAVGASPPDATRCSYGNACAVGTQRAPLEPRQLPRQEVYTTTRNKEEVTSTLQEEFPEELSTKTWPSYSTMVDKSSTRDNFVDSSSQSTSLGRSFSGYHDLIELSNYSFPSGRLCSGDHNLESNIYESIYDSTENYYVEAENSSGIHAPRQAFIGGPKTFKVNKDGCCAFSSPAHDSSMVSYVSDYNLVASWPSTVKNYNKECQLPPPPNNKSATERM